MPRGVRFSTIGAQGDEEAGTLAAESGGKFTGASLLGSHEEARTSRILSRILNQHHFDAAEREFKREVQLMALGEEMFGGLVVLSYVAFVLCIVMLAMYIHLQPVAPDFEVLAAGFVSVSITPLTAAQIEQQTSSGSGNYFAAYFTFNTSFTILFSNSNTRVDMFVESMQLTIFYNGFRLGSTKSWPFTQPRSTAQSLRLFVTQQMLPVPLNVYYTMTSGSKKNYFGVDILMKGRMSTVGSLRSPPFTFRVRCNLVLENFVITDKQCRKLN